MNGLQQSKQEEQGSTEQVKAQTPDVEKVKSIIQEYYTKRLLYNIKHDINTGGAYPIRKAIKIV